MLEKKSECEYYIYKHRGQWYIQDGGITIKKKTH